MPTAATLVMQPTQASPCVPLTYPWVTTAATNSGLVALLSAMRGTESTGGPGRLLLYTAWPSLDCNIGLILHADTKAATTLKMCWPATSLCLCCLYHWLCLQRETHHGAAVQAGCCQQHARHDRCAKAT
jgi:hypothetical protein